MSTRRAIDWDSITINDNYMFCTVFSDPALCRELLERVLGLAIERVEIASGEKTLVPEAGAKGIRLDVYAADAAGTVYDVELQNANEGNLEKRSRYYLAAIDVDRISPGHGYDQMGDTFVVFVCSFDPFGRGLARYTVTPHCREDSHEMPDGATRVFANARAYEKCEDSRLRCFLEYLTGGTIGDEFTSNVDEAVRRERARPEWRRERMRLDLYILEECAKARNEGREEGIDIGIGLGEVKGREEGIGLGEDAALSLAQALYSAGRADEIAGALADGACREALMREFGLVAGDRHNS